MNRFPIENIDKVRNAILADSASSASKLSSSKNISLSGDVSGSVSFDGSSDSSITATIKDDSHNHVISNIDNLQSTIDTINTALASKGIKLSVNGKTVSLLDSNDNILSSITTQDTNTTYNVATTSANGLMASTDKTNLNSAIKSITRSGTTFTFTRVDGTTGTFTQQDNNTTYSQATASTLGLVKLYTSTGSSTDGTMTRAAITSALSSNSGPVVLVSQYFNVSSSTDHVFNFSLKKGAFVSVYIQQTNGNTHRANFSSSGIYFNDELGNGGKNMSFIYTGVAISDTGSFTITKSSYSNEYMQLYISQ